MIRPLALVCGDIHCGDTDPLVYKALEELCELLKPKTIILHDLLDAKSINHHEKRKNIKRALLYQNNLLSLENELKIVATQLNKMSSWVESAVVVKSNHDMFLEEILEDGRYVSDPINAHICSKLATAMMDGYDPVKFGVEMCGLTAQNVTWLQLDEDFEVAGIQCGAHGHKGPNGSRGSIKNFEASYGAVMFGHGHSAGILRKAVQVGTSSYLKLGYNAGPSSWTQTSGLIYPNGGYQLINFINGKFRLED